MGNCHVERAEEQFGYADLAPQADRSFVKVGISSSYRARKPLRICPPAKMESAYRFIRNEHIDANVIANAGFQATVEQAKSHNALLAIQDKTWLGYRYSSILDNLGHRYQANRHGGLMRKSLTKTKKVTIMGYGHKA